MNDFATSPTGNADDERLRRLLSDAVADVEPGDGLAAIRSRVSVTPLHARRSWILGAAAAAVATAATVTAVALTSNGGGAPEPDGPGFAASPTAGQEPSGRAEPTQEPGQQSSQGPDPSGEPSPDESAPPATTETVPAYYVGDTSRGVRLFREFHSVTTGDAAAAAVDEAVAGNPDDPDYRSLWPDGVHATSVEYDGDVITVDLDTGGQNLHDRPSGMTEEEAAQAVEQVLYTAQAAVQQGRPGVQLLLDGRRTDQVLGQPASEPLAEGDPLDVLAQVWVIEPSDSTEVSAPFTVTGLANAFEANVQWELKQGDTVVKRGFTTAAEAMTMAPYSFKVDAPPGQYTLVVHDSDPSGGEGFAPWEDTKQVTVAP